MTTHTPAGRNVLVVDDDRTLRHAITSLLLEAGYQTDQAGDGPEALRLQFPQRFRSIPGLVGSVPGVVKKRGDGMP